MEWEDPDGIREWTVREAVTLADKLENKMGYEVEIPELD
jgi:hypothetical protein